MSEGLRAMNASRWSLCCWGTVRHVLSEASRITHEAWSSLIGYSVLLVLALAFVPAIVLAPHDLIAETDAPSTAGLPSAETMESNVESAR